MVFFRTENIGISFGGLNALSNISLGVEEGEIHGLIGPNGSGKTTFFNVISAIYAPRTGKVIFLEKDITRLKPYEVSALGMARTFQKSELFGGMNVLENVMTGFHKNADSNLLGISFRTRKYRETDKALKEEAFELLTFVGMKDYETANTTDLPFGKQRLVELGRCLATKPKFLLLDEPVAGMNPTEAVMLSEIIYRIRKEMKITILIIEHTIDFILSISDRISVLNYGEMIAQGTPSEIKENRKVINIYLGKSE